MIKIWYVVFAGLLYLTFEVLKELRQELKFRRKMKR